MLGRRSLRLAARLLSPGLLAGAPSTLPLRSSQALLSTLSSNGSWSGSGPTSASSGRGSGSGSHVTHVSSSSGPGFAPSSLFSWRSYSAAAAAEPDGQDATDPADELPLWRYLRQQGFSADGIKRMQRKSSGRRPAVSGRRMNEDKLQRGLAPNIAALRAERLDTASIQQLYEQYPNLLTTTHATFSSALAALRQLAALLPDDPHAVQAPAGATQLGMALWLYHTAAARLLAEGCLGSLIEGNLQLRRQLGVSDAETAVAVFKNNRVLATNLKCAEAMVAHLQRLRASGALPEEQVGEAALLPAVLHLTPAKFDNYWAEGGMEALRSITYKDPAGRKQVAAEALGELLQESDGVYGPLQPQYRQQGDALVKRSRTVWTTGPAALRASWASLQQLGLSSSQVVAAVQTHATVLTYNWEGEAKQRLLAWVQQELGLSPLQFLARHAGYAGNASSTLAMRADFLRQHRPALYADTASRGAGPLLSLLTDKRRLARTCTAAELAAFNRTWLATPAGRRWGGKPRKVRRKA